METETETPQAAIDSIVGPLILSRPFAEGVVAVDFETFYRTEKLARAKGLAAVSAELQGNYGYCRHPEWEAYMVSIFGPGISYVGPVEDAPWGDIAGKTWVSHNRNFDRHVFERCCELGQVNAGTDPLGRDLWADWHDTADLAAYSHLPRALNRAVGVAWGIKLDKGARTKMDGVRWSSVPAEDRDRILAYALDDSKACWALWARYAPDWPESEQALSQHTGEIEFRGVPVDAEGIGEDLSVLHAARAAVLKRIPWYETDDEAGKPVALRSRAALDAECLKRGVPPPETTNSKAAEFLDWLDEYGERVPAVVALAQFRRVDRAISVYQALKARIRPDGRAAVGLKYCGADKTLRWSGANKFNLQNLMKAAMTFDAGFNLAETGPYAVDIRRRVKAAEGNTLIIADLSQIEPRILNWIIGNEEFLRLCASGMNPYEAHARTSMGWCGGVLKKENPPLYALAKARLIALGYGAGWHKFITMARGYMGSEEQFLAVFAAKVDEADVESFLSYLDFLVEKLKHKPSKAARVAWPTLDEETQNIWVNSWLQVTHFRKNNSDLAAKDTGLWSRLDTDFKRSERDGGVFEVSCPGGYTLRYFGVTSSRGWTATPGNPCGIPQRTYGGLLTENLVQHVARMVFGFGILNLEAHGYRVLFHVHDEVIVEAPVGTDPAEVIRLLTEVPPWAAGLPIAAEAVVSDVYTK